MNHIYKIRSKNIKDKIFYILLYSQPEHDYLPECNLMCTVVNLKNARYNLGVDLDFIFYDIRERICIFA